MPPKKKSKSAKSLGKAPAFSTKPTWNARSMTGKLARLLEMPVDVWLEIVSHLTLQELLHLSWTSRRFRTLLMSREQRHLWAAARRNMGLPELPCGMSELRVAAALFGTACFECGRRAQKCNLDFVVRYCSWCWKQNYKSSYNLGEKCGLFYSKTPDCLELLPSTLSRWGYGAGEYSLREFRTVRGRHHALKEAGDDTALQSYIDERKQYVLAMRNFSLTLKEWDRGQQTTETDPRDVREQSIKAKLLEHGYTKADIPEDSWYYLPKPLSSAWRAIVRQNRELTPRIWANILPRLEELIAEAKVAREDHERELRLEENKYDLRDAYYDFLPNAPVADGPLPNAEEATELPAARALLEEDDGRIPMTAERFKILLPAFQEAARRTKADFVKAAWAHLTEISQASAARDEPEDDHANKAIPSTRGETAGCCRGVPKDMRYGSDGVLELATVLFRCYSGACTVFPDNQPRPGMRAYTITELARHVHSAHPWETFYSPKAYFASSVARKVLQKVGLPEDARYADVSGKIVCTCATFTQPATSSELISHIIREAFFYEAITAARSGSTCPKRERLVNEHDLDSDTPFLCLLDGRFEHPPLSATEAKLVATWSRKFPDTKLVCNVCTMCKTRQQTRGPEWDSDSDSDSDANEDEDGEDGPYVPLLPRMEPDMLVRHVKAMHARNAKVGDAKVAGPEV
ncbi:F-box protein [Phanerochaete sordida]|uniref:F-box protein n=1 Tax=Phanerochaete sordida TaxID=48140 RepID=A0A9P3LFQ8_9APHY|nr:F-box protein [Phanerochaete sordida]